MKEIQSENPGDGELAAQELLRDLRIEWRHLRDALSGLRFGSVTLLVQDGVVVQIERTDKRRIRMPSRSGGD